MRRLEETLNKIHYLIEHPELQRKYPEKYDIAFDRLVDRYLRLRNEAKKQVDRHSSD